MPGGFAEGQLERYYSIHGLCLRVNVPIHGLIPLSPRAPYDLDVYLESQPLPTEQDAQRLASKPSWASTADVPKEPRELSRVSTDGSHHQVRFDDGTLFLIGASGRWVYGSWPPELTLEDTLTYFLSTIIRLVLRLRGIVCLHASAVGIDGAAVALVGAAESGKSTTATAFAKLGFPILADDLVTLWPHAGQYLVQPGYRYLRLWPDSAAMLFGPRHDLPPLTPTWEKRYLDLGGDAAPFEERALPLSALYFLMPRSEGAAAPSVRPAVGVESFLTLLSEVYSSYLDDSHARVEEFHLMARVLQALPSREATPHRDPSLLPKLCELIVEDFRALRQEAGSFAA